MPEQPGMAVFSAALRGSRIVVPADALPAERRAAELLSHTLAKAAGLAPRHFPVLPEPNTYVPANAIWVGATRRGADFLRAERKPPFDTAVGFRVQAGAVFIRAERRESIEGAASWFLEKQVGARWFMPGPWGEHVPRRSALVLAPGEEIVRAGFLSRDLGVSGTEGMEWYRRNRLESRFEHGHNLTTIFRPEDLQRTPEMAAMRIGQRYIPSGPGDIYWQPNLVSPVAVAHAAAVASRAFDADPKRLSFSLSMNDAFRYDDSPATLAAVAPARFFRHRPDYSDLIFGFANAVAERVAQRHPDRYLPAYAYYWAENTPRFPIARNVVPYLTADRSQWSHPEFAAEDRALIERWTRSGAEIVGVYDYFYGAPFLVPRPTLYAVKESIPFHYRAGVRAFFAEMRPNWALDGPKPWLAAQLLWSPERNPDELLEIYYREFWAEAAEPMRAFYALCDRVWREHPAPALWLRYYEDEDQAWIYSPAQRAELRRYLDSAARAAQGEAVQARVALVSAGFGVAETFSDFWAARLGVSRLARPGANPTELLAAWIAYREARTRFTDNFADVQRTQPLALTRQELVFYLRNEPDSRAAFELARTAAGADLLRTSGLLERFIGATPAEIARLATSGVEQLRDPEWREVRMRPVGSSAAVDWVEPGGVWRGHGEPWEGRIVAMTPGRQSGRTLRIAGSRTEQIDQWVPATGGSLYTAQVKVRAKSKPGTAAFIVLNFLDEKQQHVGFGRVDRVPPSETTGEWQLSVIGRAPPRASFVGVALRVFNQIGDDFVEFSEVSLRRLPE